MWVWSPSGEMFLVWSHIHGNTLESTAGYNPPSPKKPSQTEGTAKAEESSRLQCLWGCCFFGMHNRKNSCGWENKYHKYCSQQYLLLLERHAFLSQPVSSPLMNTVSKLIYTNWWLQSDSFNSRTTEYWHCALLGVLVFSSITVPTLFGHLYQQ